jgi:hypothetical protein
MKGTVTLQAKTTKGQFTTQAEVDASQAVTGTMIHKLAARSMIRVREIVSIRDHIGEQCQLCSSLCLAATELTLVSNRINYLADN